MDRKRILVLSGGPSEEREISLLSGQAVANACTELGHDVTVSDVSPDDLSAFDQAFDLVFPMLHGSFGEDGRIQRIMEQRQIKYIGSGPTASEKCFDKARTKREFERFGIPTPKFAITSLPTGTLPERSRFCCKPARQGSSIGIEFANSQAEADAAIARIQNAFGGDVIVEEFIEGRELTVGIVGNEPLPIVEIVSANAFYDFDAKYHRQDTEYICPADLPPKSSHEIQAMALRAFESLGCRDFGRVDLILSQEGEPFFLEINTIPGFTEKSLLPKAAQQAGLDFNQLVDALIDLACDRFCPK